MNAHSPDMSRRVEIHTKAKQSPRLYLWRAFQIGKNSSLEAVTTRFTTCGNNTGVKASQAKLDADDFYLNGNVPDYVLQCVSRKLCRQ